MKVNFDTGLKVCSCCKQELPLSAFATCNHYKDKLQIVCKDCQRVKSKNYYQNGGKQKILDRGRKWRENNLEKIKESHLRYSNSEKGRKTNRVYRSKWQKNQPFIQKMIGRLRHRIWLALKGNLKSQHTFSLLSCSIEDFKKHIESQFQNGMSWNNYGKWHIDHIIPCSYFDLSDPEQQKICFNFRNLQPLWASDNLSKKDKVPENVEELVEFLKQEIYENLDCNG